MLITFSTDAYADIIMFGDVALVMLKLMGHSGTVPSAILAADVPAALSRLTAGVEAENEELSDEGEDEGEPVDDKERRVSMSNRALPLINLLTAAAQEGSDVMWK